MTDADAQIRPSSGTTSEVLYQVWHQGDDGNPFLIGDPLPQAEAERLVRHYESLGHRQ